MCVNGSCTCVPEWTGEACEVSTETDLFKAYRSGWSPIGTVVIIGVVSALVAMAAMMIFKRYRGQKGLSSVPGLKEAKSKVLLDEESKVPLNEGKEST